MSVQASSSYGVIYTPQAALAANVGGLELESRGIKYVRISWLDHINTLRHRIVPVAYFQKLLKTARPGVCLTYATFGMVGPGCAPGFSGTGEYLLVPDLNSFRICTYAPGHASVMGWFQLKNPSPSGGLSVDLCPRTLLKRIVDDAQAKAGVSFLAGFESEFILLSATSPKIVAVNNGAWSTSAKFPSGSVENTVLEEIADDLIAAGIELQMYHAESAPGQYEVVTGPLPPLEAADAVVFTRETIYNVAAKHGLRATFAPRLHADDCGSGAHMHISVHSTRGAPTGTPATPVPAPTLSAVERSFLQSLLEHLPAVCALTLPTAASYARMLDGIWSGGTYACWGTDNREAPVRLCGPPGHHHFELKCSDATASPYLVLAGAIAAGAHGVQEGKTLTIGDAAKPMFQMSEEERAAIGLRDPGRLPRTVEDARELLKQDTLLVGALGKNFVEKYLSVNQLLGDYLKKETEEETVTRLVTFY
ncbi:FLU1-II [Amylocystis lapponica]|nr:FLU1-II [Amylocystis lapponica]